MQSTLHIVFGSLLLLLVAGCAAEGPWDSVEAVVAAENQCDVAVREIVNEDRATVVDESPNRLHAVWISQECEIRAGPEYVIRKYSFYENGTFQLMRHYYAEESCSIATHSVVARGAIKILGNSMLTPGATEARYQLDTVHVSPLNRQVAHKLGHRVNASCGPQARWRPYVAQLVFERAPERAWQGPKYNSLAHQPQAQGPLAARGAKGVDCLGPLSLDFDELRLLRVQQRPTGFRAADFGQKDKPRFELFLGGLPPDHASKRSHRPTSLQPTGLLRTDTMHNCPICGMIVRGTENSPPLLHEVVALPALLGGSWVSGTCESQPGGVWLRRQLRVYAGDKLWSGRWDYFGDARCSGFLYAITAAGSYEQRARRHRRARPEDRPGPARARRAPDELDYYRQLLHGAQPAVAESFAAMLRGNQRPAPGGGPERPPAAAGQPSGTTELDLHVAESLLVAGEPALGRRCGAALASTQPALASWPRGCVPHSLDAPSTLGLRARLGVDWYGQYTLQLGARDKHLWDAPLLQCGPASLRNPLLRSHLRRSVGLKFGVLFSRAATGHHLLDPLLLLLLQLLVYLARRYSPVTHPPKETHSVFLFSFLSYFMYIHKELYIAAVREVYVPKEIYRDPCVTRRSKRPTGFRLFFFSSSS